jgi:hypothetical protein
MRKRIDARNLTDAYNLQATCDSCDDLFETHCKPPSTIDGAAWSKENNNKTVPQTVPSDPNERPRMR